MAYNSIRNVLFASEIGIADAREHSPSTAEAFGWFLLKYYREISFPGCVTD